MKKKNPQIESWAIVGFCWGGKIAALVSGEGSPFKASGQCHPSLLELGDAEKIRIPHVVLPSMDEVPEVNPLLNHFMRMLANKMISFSPWKNGSKP